MLSIICSSSHKQAHFKNQDTPPHTHTTTLNKGAAPLAGVTGPVRASAAASSEASAASSSAADRGESSLCKNTQSWAYINAATAHYSLFIKRFFFFLLSPSPLTSSSFILMSFSVSASGVEICSSGMGLSTLWSAFILLEMKHILFLLAHRNYLKCKLIRPPLNDRILKYKINITLLVILF